MRRLVGAFVANGMLCSSEQAVWLWEQYSDSMAAGWMGMSDYSDSDLVILCRPYFDELPGD